MTESGVLGISAARAIEVQTRTATKEAAQAAALIQEEKTKAQKEADLLDEGTVVARYTVVRLMRGGPGSSTTLQPS